MNLPLIPKEVAESIEYVLENCHGNTQAVLEEMINTLPATQQGLVIRRFSKENWELMIQAIVYGYDIVA